MADYLLSPEALEDLRNIRDFIAADNTQAADKLLDQFFEVFENLAKWPRQGHARADVTNRDVRFWPVGDYLVVYRENPKPLQIVAILHGARDVPKVIMNR